MSVSLRPYQEEIISKTRSLMQRGARSVLIQAPTGSGKTLLTAHMLHSAAGKGLTSWFTVHRRELIQQSRRAFRLESLDHGIISAGFPESQVHPVQIASIQTLARRHRRYPTPHLIVVDEAHHMAARSWDKLFAQYPQSFIIGLTATPERLDGKGLSKYFQAMVQGPTVSWLIQNQFLSPYRLYAPTQVNLEGIPRRMGDYANNELLQVMDKPTITGNAVAHYKRLCPGKRAIVFAVSREHSRHVVAEFNQQGISAVHVDGDTPPFERDLAVKAFSEGTLQVLSNVEIFGEGFDVPAIDAAILLRPTLSLGFYLQQVGRALRPAPGKAEAFILDHVGNCQRHGLPDAEHAWNLQGRALREKAGAEAQASVRICPSCFAAQWAGSIACKFCLYVFTVESRVVDEVAGELTEVVQAKTKARQEVGRARSYHELLAIEKQRGYKHGWAWNVLRGRNHR